MHGATITVVSHTGVPTSVDLSVEGVRVLVGCIEVGLDRDLIDEFGYSESAVNEVGEVLEAIDSARGA